MVVRGEAVLSTSPEEGCERDERASADRAQHESAD